MARPVWSADLSTVRVAVFNNGTAEVVLNRPNKSNAFNGDMWTEFKQSFEALAKRDDVRAVVVLGEGRNFCAGIDLSFFAASFAGDGGGGDQAGAAGDSSGYGSGRSSGNGSGVASRGPGQEQRAALGEAYCPARLRYRKRQEVLDMQECFNVIERLPCPVIAAVHGACVGAGVDLITACDIRYCASDAYFSVKEVDVAITADLGTLQRLPAIVGHGAAAELSLTGRRAGADEAAALGLVTGPPHATQGQLLEAARATAAAISSKSPLAVSGTKRVLLHARSHSVEEGLEYVATWNSAMLVGSRDAQEALRAAVERRAPRFSKL